MINKLLMARTETSIPHHARVFISRDSETAIVVTLHFNGKGGVLYEDSEPMVIAAPLAPQGLGRETIAALRKTQIRSPKDFAGYKLTEWPAFKASRVKSVRSFEQEYIQIHVSGANDKNLVYVIDGEPFKNSELHVTSSVSRSTPAAELGTRLVLVFHACRDKHL